MMPPHAPPLIRAVNKKKHTKIRSAIILYWQGFPTMLEQHTTIIHTCYSAYIILAVALGGCVNRALMWRGPTKILEGIAGDGGRGLKRMMYRVQIFVRLPCNSYHAPVCHHRCWYLNHQMTQRRSMIYLMHSYWNIETLQNISESRIKLK